MFSLHNGRQHENLMNSNKFVIQTCCGLLTEHMNTSLLWTRPSVDLTVAVFHAFQSFSASFKVLIHVTRSVLLSAASKYLKHKKGTRMMKETNRAFVAILREAGGVFKRNLSSC